MSEESRTLNSQIAPSLVQQAMALIQPAQRIALLAHESPDGDCIGSALGMSHILHLVGKQCIPACADAAPQNLSFLPGIETLQQTIDDGAFDLVIALDAGELRRFGHLYEEHQAFLDNAQILNIDHHISSNGCGQVNIIDTTAAATAELIVLFQQQAGLPLNRDAALCLLTGLITDTHSFQFTSTTPRSFEVAALLLRAGAIPETIVQPIYRTRPLAQARLQAIILANAQTSCDGRLIWSQATDATLTQVAAFFKSYGDPDITRLSLRCAAPYNAAEICLRLSNGLGGGHARAAGATFHLPIEETTALVVAELKKEMRC